MLFFRFITTLCLILLISGCIRNTLNTGYTIDEKRIAKVDIGETSRDDVFKFLGSPSAKSTYGKEIWYYISSTYEQIAFLKPTIKEQTIIALTFNQEGTLESINRYSEEDTKALIYSKDRTRTEGHNLGILEQLLGNIGRFNTIK